MEKTDIQFDNFKFLGTITFYIALFSENLGTIVKYESDFRKPITEDFIQTIIKNFIDYYNKKFNMKITSVQFVSKKAYEAYCEAYNDSDSVEISWKDNDIFINGKKVNN